MSDSNYGTNYALFQWNGREWLVIENACDYGCTPTLPEAPGEYEGQIVPTMCEPRWEAIQR
jgi:hypothetical protein